MIPLITDELWESTVCTLFRSCRADTSISTTWQDNKLTSM